ncbi:Peptidyl-prolyl cis-trans isomerase [Cupriavidus taiwanensis]|uniref:peptidylprolyl isomerase n=1 Tax=Cupriavidus taiwanensis TaxID=164546 RepID=UPI000E18F557|nr:peptidylprolyl isomerase [Cupriavidus taiwanensis]SOZ18508.1 Peptidyl-prolyl cis-trans isomerase [Cupriavidus taiwanensis]SOZ31618.1 Peptidyl-prolyl cis-trans isomerase [Cupriavidus taiwanensis]SOZ47541.1 Peptidyl-prolyl cis-trans isomerase [Cupriavidus taiwanensis]
MPVTVNGVELRDADIERELDHHHDADNPARLATISAILRLLMRAEAARIGLDADAMDDDALAQALLAREAATPEADHILFQVTPRVPLDALREVAAQTLALVRGDPASFAHHAGALSNCPSGANGGRLGRVFRGETAPEFERALFTAQHDGVLPQLVQTRFGLHIVRILERCPGTRLPFEAVRGEIARALDAAARDRAWKQYASLLVGRARIEGIELEGADSPLVQ